MVGGETYLAESTPLDKFSDIADKAMGILHNSHLSKSYLVACLVMEYNENVCHCQLLYLTSCSSPVAEGYSSHFLCIFSIYSVLINCPTRPDIVQR